MTPSQMGQVALSKDIVAQREFARRYGACRLFSLLLRWAFRRVRALVLVPWRALRRR